MEILKDPISTSFNKLNTRTFKTIDRAEGF